jgi:chemosensory pili system protein ChpA (sensor histidine kinase/response regulator)
MVPFQRHTNRLARLVRQVATEHGKQVELQVLGSGDIDRQVLEKILPPIEHMLRNAIVHGIEASTEREAAGKPSAGQITIALKREGSQIVLEISDDGAGIDVDAVRRKAVELGVLDADADITEEQIVQFILRAGFSTADQVTHAAGRGVGMDVVASEITNLGGTLRTQTKHGHGTTFTVRLPFTLAVTQALIVRAASEMYAIPLPTVEGIIRISRKELEQKLEADDPSIEYGGRSYQIRHLGQYLGLGPSKFTDEVDRISIVIVEAGSNSTALVADEMLDSREIVVKPVGTQLSSIVGVSGATIMGDGRVVVILDAGALVRTTIQPASALERETAEEPDQLMALVVDDSITMRRVTQRLLERNDMRVVTAKDGVEAITMLREHPPDIILLDIEMPRMDGYQFAKHVRNESAVRDVPIIMITSRVSDEHKARAIELGVNDYLGKPYQESALLEAVNHLLHPDESGNEPKE